METSEIIGKGMVLDAGPQGPIVAIEGYEGIGFESYAASGVAGKTVYLPITVTKTGRKTHYHHGATRVRVAVRWFDGEGELGEPAGAWLYLS